MLFGRCPVHRYADTRPKSGAPQRDVTPEPASCCLPSSRPRAGQSRLPPSTKPPRSPSVRMCVQTRPKSVAPLRGLTPEPASCCLPLSRLRAGQSSLPPSTRLSRHPSVRMCAKSPPKSFVPLRVLTPGPAPCSFSLSRPRAGHRCCPPSTMPSHPPSLRMCGFCLRSHQPVRNPRGSWQWTRPPNRPRFRRWNIRLCRNPCSHPDRPSCRIGSPEIRRFVRSDSRCRRPRLLSAAHPRRWSHIRKAHPCMSTRLRSCRPNHIHPRSSCRGRHRPHRFREYHSHRRRSFHPVGSRPHGHPGRRHALVHPGARVDHGT